MISVKLSDIGFPEHYVRGKTSKPHIQYLLEIAKSSSNKSWPFHDPIILAKNTAPEVRKKLNGEEKGKGKKRAKTFKAYEIIDGQHRFLVMKILKAKELQANISNEKSGAERFLMQYEKNQHGLKLEPLYRSQAIWTMRHIFKLPLNDIAKETGLTKSSVSRIAAKKTGWIVKKKPPTKKVNGSNGGNGGKQLFTPSQFSDRLTIMVDEFQTMKTLEIKNALQNTLGTKMSGFLVKLRSMLDLFAQV